MLEHRTVFVVQSGLLLLLSGVVLLVYRDRRRRRKDGSAAWLSAAYLTSGLGLALLAMDPAVHPQLSTILGNAMLLAFAGLAGRAFQETTGQPVSRGWVGMLALDAAAIAACSYFTYIAPDWWLRDWVSGVVTAAMFGWLILQIRRSREDVIQPAVKTIAWLLALHIAVHVARLVVWRFVGLPLWFSGMNILTIAGVALSFLWMDGLRSRDEMERAAITDPLTGLFNRRAIDRFREEVRRSALAGEPLSALMMDVDRFKEVNDTYGHNAGDLALCAIAAVLKSVCDRSIRSGGDEFFALLPGHDQAAAERVAARIHAAVSELALQSPGGEIYTVSVSIGCATLHGTATTITDLMHAGDVLLYAEKQRLHLRRHRESFPATWHEQDARNKVAPPTQ